MSTIHDDAPAAISPWRSKTFLLSLASLVSLLFPQVRTWLETNPVETGAAFSGLLVFLKFATWGYDKFQAILQEVEDAFDPLTDQAITPVTQDSPHHTGMEPVPAQESDPHTTTGTGSTSSATLGTGASLLMACLLPAAALLSGCGLAVSLSDDGYTLKHDDKPVITVTPARK